jgi:hypothetical protein
MGIFTTSRQARENERRVQQALFEANQAGISAADAQGKVTELGAKVKHYRAVQELLVKDILTLQEVSSSNKGNDYPDYANAVEAIASKYCGTADWGVVQTGAVIDLRAAFILGEGIKVTHTTETRAEAERELAFAKAFLAYNGLDSEMAHELVKESEIEGKCAVKLFYEDLTDEPLFGEWPGMVSARFISWTSKRYEVIADAQDYLWYKQLKWTPKGADKGEVLEEPEFVYKKFGGRMNDPNDAQPKIMKCLTQIDRLDKALRDLRLINNLFASPTPDFMVEDQSTANLLLDQIKDINWKIGKAIVHTGQFQLVSPDVSGVENLIAEIELNTKLISGATGIPIHYLGLLDLLKNRATGDNTRELVMAATTRERGTWVGAFEEMLDKAMEMYNRESGDEQRSTKLDPNSVKVSIPLITEEQYAHIQNVFIPAAVAGIISKEFVAEQIPGIDLEAEAKRREESETKEMEQAKQDLEMMRTRVVGAGGSE